MDKEQLRKLKVKAGKASHKAKLEKHGEEGLKEILRKKGQKGGQKTAKRGSDYYREIGRKGLAKRWKKNTS